MTQDDFLRGVFVGLEILGELAIGQLAKLLHLVEGPVEIIVGAGLAPAVDGRRRIAPRGVDLSLREVAGVDHVGEHVRRPGAGRSPSATSASQFERSVLPMLLARLRLGLLPPEHAVYVYRDFGLKGDRCYSATYQKPEFGEKGFFSFIKVLYKRGNPPLIVKQALFLLKISLIF